MLRYLQLKLFFLKHGHDRSMLLNDSTFCSRKYMIIPNSRWFNLQGAAQVTNSLPPYVLGNEGTDCQQCFAALQVLYEPQV
jgi:hypothetical protein